MADRILCSVCGRPPHQVDDPECMPATKPIAEKLAWALEEIERLRADGLRLDWLETQRTGIYTDPQGWITTNGQLREAIDAAHAALAAPQATAVGVPDEVASPKAPHPTSPLWGSKGNPIHANIDALREQQRLAALALAPSPSAGEAVSEDTKRMDWLDALSNEALLEFGFEIEGGVYLCIEAPGAVKKDIREMNSVRAAIDFAMLITP